MRKFCASLAVAALASTCFTAPAHAAGQFYAFGDSLVDNGNTIKFIGVTYPPAPYVGGKFSNGEVWAQYFPSLTGLGFTASNDYAVGGAYAGPLSVLGTNYNNIESLPATLGEPGLPTTLPSFLSEVTEFQATGQHFSNSDVVGVWVGANDYFTTLALVNAGYENGTTAIPAAIQLVAQQTTEGVNELVNLGARRFVVASLPDLGETPEFNRDPATTIGIADEISEEHNITLAEYLASEHASTGANIILINAQQVFSEILANPAAYGKTNTTQACISVLACVTASTAVQNQYVFWDAVHPTTGTHLIIAEYAADALNNVASNAVPAQLGGFGAQAFAGQLADRLEALRQGSTGFAISLPDQGVNATVGRGSKLSGFITGGYSYGDRHDIGADNGFTHHTDSVAAGVDGRLTNGIAAGVAVGYEGGHADVNYGGTVSSAGYHFGGYAGFFEPQFYLNLALSYGVDSYKTSKAAVLPGAITARPAGDDVSVGVDTGYVLHAAGLTYGPVAGVHLTNTSLRSYSESGDAALTQQVSAQTYSDVVGDLGATASTSVPLGPVVLYPHLTASWDHLVSGNGGTFSSVFTDEPTVVLTNAYPSVSQNWGVVSGGLTAPVSSMVAVHVAFTTTIAKSDGEDHEVSGGVQIRF
jgi:outer membrane lipase/esterase